jgi:hypothetical protein
VPADNDLDPVDRWLGQHVWPMSPPDGTFEQVTKRARRRRVRKAAVSVASAAAVVAAIAVAVPLSMSSGLGSAKPPSSAAGSTDTPASHKTQSTDGTGTKAPPTPSASTAGPSPTTSASPNITDQGFLPPNFKPFSVTWTSQYTGWVIGPAGTAGKCGPAGNSAICTSIARTDDSGQTWQGVNAPVAEGPYGATGVSNLRFLNPTYGWAFGPDLYATVDSGQNWHQVSTGGYSVVDLEATYGQAYALFGKCSPAAGTTGDTIAACTSFTLETSAAGNDNWTPVAGVPAVLSSSTSKYGTAVIEIAGPTGYLVAPDGALYSGAVDGSGGAWRKTGQLPCVPGASGTDGLPDNLLLAGAGTTSSGDRLGVVCAKPTVADTVVYVSDNGGASWNERSNVGAGGTSTIGTPQSLTALSDGTLILATDPSTTSSGGIYLLGPAATQWQPATLANASGKSDGFSYVGMTTPLQGVAIGGDPGLDGIWMTTDGGLTWAPRPITSG